MNDLRPGNTAIILAAGENTRLKGLIPAFMKPMLLVNGSPLLHHAEQHARRDWDCNQIIVVAAPENASAITQLLQHDQCIQYVLQPKPNGVVDAIRRAIWLAEKQRVVILCADNMFEWESRDSQVKMYRDDFDTSYIGTRGLPEYRAERFTRLAGVPPHMQIIPARAKSNGSTLCWIGPLVLRTERVQRVLLQVEPQNIETLISLSTDGNIVPMAMRCQDMGIPDEWRTE